MLQLLLFKHITMINICGMNRAVEQNLVYHTSFKSIAIVFQVLLLVSGIQDNWYNFTFNKCTKKMFLQNNYNDTKQDLVLAIYLKHDDLDASVESALAYTLSEAKQENSSDFNVNILMYQFSDKCNIENLHLFLDILLNASLNNGKPFKIMGIIAYMNNEDLTHLANIASAYSIAVVGYLISGSSNIVHVQSIHNYYKNVFLFSFSKTGKIHFLIDFVKKFDVDLVTILHQTYQNSLNEVNTISDVLSQNSVCVNVYDTKDLLQRNNEYFKILMEKKYSNAYLIVNKDYHSLRSIFETSSYKNDSKTFIVYNNYDNESLVESMFKATFFHESAPSNADIILVYTDNDTLTYSIIGFYEWIHRFIEAAKSSYRISKPEYTSVLPNRIFGNVYLKELLLQSKQTIYKSELFVNLFVGLVQHRHGKVRNKMLYATGGDGYRIFKLWNIKNDTSLNPRSACSRNCKPGKYPLFIGSKCCGICVKCSVGSVKPLPGQQQCFRCSENAAPNLNQTKCLSFEYKYYLVSFLNRVIAVILSSLGFIFGSLFLIVFLLYKNTPIVKASNLRLSIIQLLLHLILNYHLIITVFKQSYIVCLLHSVPSGYLLKLILSIYIIKTNQLLTIFKSTLRVERTQFLKLKELFFPFLNLVINAFVTVMLLTEFKYQFGILEDTASLVRYQYCNMNVYLNVDILFLMLLTLGCSIQSFWARKLPANFNETYYIFLGMFASVILTALYFPLNASFSKDGQKIFVNSCIIFSINMALMIITYGYKIVIILFQKDKNTKEVFQKIMLECIQKEVNKHTGKSTVNTR